MEVVIVGGGPVACLLAIELRARNVVVRVYEKKGDPRNGKDKGYSYDLSLSRRGLSALSAEIKRVLFPIGTLLPQRIVHNGDGSVAYQQYSTNPEDSILSISRSMLYKTLLSDAESKGAIFNFNCDCIRVDTVRAEATFVAHGKVFSDRGTFLIGADGANSFVRYEMSRRFGNTMSFSQENSGYGHADVKLAPTADGKYSLQSALRNPEIPESSKLGVHVWPRGDFMLLATPNPDFSYCGAFFMPLEKFDVFCKSEEEITQFCESNFPDFLALHPTMVQELKGVKPAPLRVVKCSAFHQGLTVLVGDAAHTMVPFFAQGINCCFEDVQTLFALLDKHQCFVDVDGPVANGESSPTSSNGGEENCFQSNLHRAFAEYTAVRKGPCDAMTAMSMGNLRDLSSASGKKDYNARRKLDTLLHKTHPTIFAPLYQMVAFSTIPYDVVLKRHQEQEAILQELCRTFDLHTQQDAIIEAYAAKVAKQTAKNLTTSVVDCPLQLTQEQTKSLLDSTTSRLLSFFEDVHERKLPVSFFYDSLDMYKYQHGLDVCAQLRELSPPQQGAPFEELLDTIFKVALPCGLIQQHPGGMAHVPSGGLIQGAVGEFISRAVNRFAGVWMDNPGFSQIETNVIHWFCEMLGYGEGSFGYLTTGGSTANLISVVCAAQSALERAAGRNRIIYMSSQSHFSNRKAAKIAGFTDECMRKVATRTDFSMDVDSLTASIIADIEAGHCPTCVIATGGTTNTGAIDDLVAIAAICQRYNVWLHVDAAWGGFFHITQRGKAFLRGIELADSITVDAHKSLFLSHGISAALVKDRRHLRNTFQITAEYMMGFSRDNLHNDFCQLGPELTREIRGLTVWLPLKMHGLHAFEQCLDRTMDLAAQLLVDLRTVPGIEVVQEHALNLPVVNFKVLGANDEESVTRTRDVCAKMCSYGHVFLVTTELPGHGVVLRVCIQHHLTDEVILDHLLRDLHIALKEVNAI